MLPRIRQEEGLYPVPQFSIEKTDIGDFMDELKGFHGAFADCFSRSEPRENFGKYMTGQFAQLERKSIEPIAFHIEGCDPGCMQYMISDALWDEEKMLRKYHGMVSEDMGEPDGVLIFDESGFVKKGEESAGVSRQYCGSLGKVENCQVGVSRLTHLRRGMLFWIKDCSFPKSGSMMIIKIKEKKRSFPRILFSKRNLS